VASKSKRARTIKQRNLAKDFMYWAIAVFVIKLIIIGNVQGRAWLGADGESYLKGTDSIIQKGIFSTDSVLNYWPAGYPLFIFLLSLIGKGFVLTTLSVVQSAIYSFATYFFAAQLAKTRLRKFASLSFLMILLNPTLSLSSIAVGYETPAAAGYLIVAGLIIKDFVQKNDKILLPYVAISSAIFGFMSFIQPRLIASGILINLLWIFARKPWKSAAVLIATSLAITLFFPATLIYRNHKAVGLNTISTNLGVTMNIGAGEKSTGGYTNSATGVDCKNSTSDVVKADREQVACILKWYVANPKLALKLFYNKSIFFWSPWYGPEANGTMARNPWLKINPIKNISESSPDGQKLVFGGFGKLVSWFWLLVGLTLFIYGFLILWRMKSMERIIGAIAAMAVMSSWLITLISIGDHRFRLPVMGMSLFLQAVGIRTLFKGGKPPMVDGPGLR
jgi:hypothetical protein